jgi:glycosyltransferase involved in cell wall biosynthesis
MLSPSISVIIPNYNHAVYLKARIDSVLAQTYQNFEIILLDDCSIDDSKQVVEEYRACEKVTHIVLNEINSGTTFKQWARGIELAKNDWIWIAESDDWCEPTFLQTLVDGIEDTTCLCFCQSVAVKGEDILWVNSFPYLTKSYQGKQFVDRYMLKMNNLSNASMAIFKKDVYNKVSKSFKDYKFCGDWLFWILIAQHGEVYISGKYLNYFRKHDKDVSGPSLRKGLLYKEYIPLLRELVAYNIIAPEFRDELLMLKLTELLWNNRVDARDVEEISWLYFQELGNKLNGIKAYSILGKRNYLKIAALRMFSVHLFSDIK